MPVPDCKRNLTNLGGNPKKNKHTVVAPSSLPHTSPNSLHPPSNYTQPPPRFAVCSIAIAFALSTSTTQWHPPTNETIQSLAPKSHQCFDLFAKGQIKGFTIAQTTIYITHCRSPRVMWHSFDHCNGRRKCRCRHRNHRHGQRNSHQISKLKIHQSLPQQFR